MKGMDSFYDCAAGILPILILFVAGIIILLMDAFTPPGRKGKLDYVALAGSAFALLSLALPLPAQRELFGQMLYADNFTIFFHIVLLAGTVLVVLLSASTLEKHNANIGEYYSLLLFSTLGMMLMAQAANLIMVFLGLEILSISIYILVGIYKTEAQSNEASLKYFLLGAFASGFFLYGMTFVYGSTGTLSLSAIAVELAKADWLKDSPLFFGIALMLVGFGFKMALVPFHMWTPDVYQGAPTPITAYMSVGVKAAIFAALGRFFWIAAPSIQPYWAPVLWVLCVLTMTAGNVFALVQDNVKRMLAYSSIAHAGYILMAFVAFSQNGLSAMLIYLLVYTFMNVGPFGVMVVLQDRFGEGENFSDFRGLGFRYPALAAVMSIFLFSLAGVPPTAGFVAKFFMFGAVIEVGQIGLAIIGVLNSVVAAYYYLRLVVTMYSQPAEEKQPVASLRIPAFCTLALIIAVWATLQIGILPSSIREWANWSVGGLL